MILVIGCGHVGNTIANNLSNVIKIDPKLNDNKIEDFIYDGAVICLPTPTVDGHCDDSLIEETEKTKAGSPQRKGAVLAAITALKQHLAMLAVNKILL